MPTIPSRAWRLGCVLAAVLLLAGTLLVPVPVHRSAVESEGAIAFTERTVHTEWHGAWSFVGDYVEHFSVLYRGLVGAVLACLVAVLALVAAVRGRGDGLAGWLLVLTVGALIAIGPAATIAGSSDPGRGPSLAGFGTAGSDRVDDATIMAIAAALVAGAAGITRRSRAARWIILTASVVLVIGILNSTTVRAFPPLEKLAEPAALTSEASRHLVRRHILVDQVFVGKTWEVFWPSSLVVILYALLGVSGVLAGLRKGGTTWLRRLAVGLGWALLVGGSALMAWQVHLVFDSMPRGGHLLKAVLPMPTLARTYVIQAGYLLALALAVHRLLDLTGAGGGGRREDQAAGSAAEAADG